MGAKTINANQTYQASSLLRQGKSRTNSMLEKALYVHMKVQPANMKNVVRLRATTAHK